jgi:TRAP-type C4-dicarboxylate transport system substrate-binding protein
MTRTCIAAVFVAGAAMLAGCSLGGGSDKAGGGQTPATTVLTLANFGNSEGPLSAYAQAVARESEGSLQIRFENAWRAGDLNHEQHTISDVRAGKADMAAVSARAFDTVGIESFQPLLAPLAVDSYALQQRVLQSPLADGMLRDVERLHVLGVALLPGELRRPLGVARPLVSAADYRGARIAIRPSALSSRTVKALGGSPVPYLQGSEVTQADGAEVSLDTVEGDRLDGPARTLATNVVLWPRPTTIVMDPDVYAALDDAQRRALRVAGRSAIRPVSALVAGSDREVAGVVCRRHQVEYRSATPSQLDTFRTALRPLRRELERRPSYRAVAQQIDAMRAGLEREPELACDSAEHGGSTSATTPVDGVWRMDTTARDLAKIDQQDIAPENWGRQTFVLTRGRFAVTEENHEACVWGFGRYTLTGNTFELNFANGGGKAPTKAANRPGESFRYRWSRYRDRLTLAPVKGAISPANFRVKSWQRLSDEPVLASLSPHCQPPTNALQP